MSREPRRQNVNQKEEYPCFPPEDLKSATFKDPDELKQILNNNQFYQYSKKCQYLFDTARFVCKFKSCKSSIVLKYNKSTQKYYVRSMCCQHIHPPILKKSQTVRRVFQFLEKRNVFYLTAKHSPLLKQNFGISYGCFQNIQMKVNSKFKFQYSAELEQLRNNDLQLQYFRTIYDKKIGTQLPETILAYDRQMKDSFAKFGDSCRYDVLYDVVVNRKNQKLFLGCFTGFNESNIPILFSVVVSTNSTAANYKRIFWAFFREMKKAPQTLITSLEKSITEALASLKQTGDFSGYHLLDAVKIRDVLLSYCSDQNEKQVNQLTELLKLFFKSRNKKDIAQVLRQLQQMGQGNILRDLGIYKEKVSLYYAPRAFIGTSIVSGKTPILLKTALKLEATQKLSPVSFTTAIIELKRLNLKILQQKINKASEDQMPQTGKVDQHLNEARQNLSTKVFDIVMDEYLKAQKLTFKLVESKHVFEDLHFVENEQCSCGMWKQVELPCQHLLRVFMVLEEPYLKKIGKRWIVN